MICKREYIDCLLTAGRILFDDLTFWLLNYFVKRRGDDIHPEEFEKDFGIADSLLSENIYILLNLNIIEKKEKIVTGKKSQIFFSFSESFYQKIKARFKTLKEVIEKKLREKEMDKHKCKKCKKEYKEQDQIMVILLKQGRCPDCKEKLELIKGEDVSDIRRKTAEILKFIEEEFVETEKNGPEYEIPLKRNFKGAAVTWKSIMNKKVNTEFVQAEKIKNGRCNVDDIEFGDLETPEVIGLKEEIVMCPGSEKAQVFNKMVDILHMEDMSKLLREKS